MTRVTAIVLSFNRPNLLRAALATVVANRPNEVIVVDDGSDFDVFNIVGHEFVVPFGEAKTGTVWKIVGADRMTVAERLVTPRLGGLINQALDDATGDVCTYLCDDDLWCHGWLDTVRGYFAAHPDAALVRGEWRGFSGALPGDDAPPCTLDARQMTTGNFAHRLPAPARWPEHTVSSHDDVFLWNLQRAGVNTFEVPNIGRAGYRREHAHNAIHFTVGHNYTPQAVAMLAGMLEDEQ